MKEYEYTLENLIKTFSRHAEIEQKTKNVLRHQVESGQVEEQEWMKETLNISFAFKLMCEEIQKLKCKKGK